MSFTVLSALALAFVDNVRAIGLDPDAILAEAGLSGADLEDPDARLPGASYLALWETIAARDPRLGIALAREWRPEMLGVVGYVMMSSATVRDAFDAWARYARLLGEPLVPFIEASPDRFLFRRALPERFVRNRLFPETAIAGTAVFIERLTGTAPPVREVCFQHGEPADGEALRAFYRCPVSFGQLETTVEFPAAVATAPVRRADPALRRFLDRYAGVLAADLRDEPPLVERVRTRVAAVMAQGEPAQATIARELAMSERTLQRRLREEGTTFAEVVDGLRRELALRHLRDPQMTVHAVAFLLGYSEPSAFHRAFRRWTGTTPRGYRQSH